MKMISFKLTKKKFKRAFREILNQNRNYEIDEAAIPAYAHNNIFIDYLFWKRLQIVFNFAKK